MRTSGPGNRAGKPRGNSRWVGPGAQAQTGVCARGGLSRGFTLIELLVVVAIVALSSALVTLALRDPDADQLEQEAQRLIVLLETARAESRTAGVGVQWAPLSDEDRAAIQGTDFRFVGLTTSTPLPTRWLDQETRADLVGQRTLTLGPEPFIGPQRVVLRLGDRRLSLATDGLAPFAVQDEPASP